MNKKINIENKKIQDEILNLKKTLLNLNFQKSSGQLEKTSQIKNAKKQIARLKTKLSNINGEKMPKRILSGVVVSSNSNKTITVDVTRRIKHKLYKKIIRQTKKYHAHDENNEFNVGDTVSIIESKPISKLKKWKVISNTGEKS